MTDLANELHVSKSQVGRIFMDAFGKSPIAYLTMLRTEQMAKLLRTTDLPIAVIARQVGWRDRTSPLGSSAAALASRRAITAGVGCDRFAKRRRATGVEIFPPRSSGVTRLPAWENVETPAV